MIQFLTDLLAVTVAATLSCALGGVLSVPTLMTWMSGPPAALNAGSAASTRSVQTVTSCFHAAMIRVSSGFQLAALKNSAAFLPTSSPICLPLKPIRGTILSAEHAAGFGLSTQIWSSEVSSWMLELLAAATTAGPTDGSG